MSGAASGGAGGRIERTASIVALPHKPQLEDAKTCRVTADGEAEPETLDVADAPSRATWIVKPGDVITSLVRPIRQLSAMIHDHQGGCVCSSGFCVLSPNPSGGGIEPEVLLTYLRLPLVCELLDLNTTASMYPAIPVDRLKAIPILVPDTKTRRAVVGLPLRAQPPHNPSLCLCRVKRDFGPRRVNRASWTADPVMACGEPETRPGIAAGRNPLPELA